MNPNEVLLWLSAKRAGSWVGYRATLEEMVTLAAEDDDEAEESELPLYQRFRFNFERLAHVEFRRPDFPNAWRVVPPTIAATSEKTIGILCGARTDQLVTRIHQNIRGVRITAQPECPDRIEFLLTEDLDSIAADYGLLIQHDATESLLAALPSIDDWQLRAPFELPFGNDAPVSRFYATRREWAPSSAGEARNAQFGLFRWQLPYERHYYLKHRKRAYRVAVQVGKYIVLHQERQRVLTFDPTRETLTVPVACRPPMLVDRALTLRTGLLPDIQRGALVYQNITRSIAMMVAAILRQ